MAIAPQLLSELYLRSVQALTSSLSVWTGFLKVAGRNYKCPCDKQILIYAQRPDATAVLEIEKWNKQFGRWVNRGSRGIAVFGETTDNGRGIKYYFDISDTHESKYAKPVPVWHVQPEYEAEIIETLENSFGELAQKDSLATALISAAQNAVNDNMSDYLPQFDRFKEDSRLEELSAGSVETVVRNALTASVAYMFLHRCGVDADRYVDVDDFQSIAYFNTPETANILGAATGDIAKIGLREIGSTVIALQNEKIKKAVKTPIRTFAKDNHTEHTEGTVHKNERSIDNERADIHPAGGLSDTGFSPATAKGRRTPWEIWAGEAELSERASERGIHNTPDDVQVGRTPERDRRNGERAHGADGKTDGAGAGSDGGIESQRPDALGGYDEQHQEQRGGDDTEGIDNGELIIDNEGIASGDDSNNYPLSTIPYQLTLLPTEEEQRKSIEATEEVKTSAFSINQADIDAEICNGSGFQDGKFRIFSFFKQGHTLKEKADFLKKEYGIGGHTPLGGSGVYQNHDGQGLHLHRGLSDKPITLPWNKVSKRIDELISDGWYMSQAELEVAVDSGQLTIDSSNNYPLSPINYQLELGVTVYIGTDEYEIYSFDDSHVALKDVKMPLFTTEMPREEFDRKLRENPLNDGLRAIDSGQVTIDSYDSPKSSDALSPINYQLPSPGDRYEIEGRLFIVESVDTEWNKVSLRDVTFENGVGFPIFRSETLDFMRKYETAKAVDSGQVTVDSYGSQKGSEQLSTVNSQLSTALPMAARHNYRITDDNLGAGGQKTKFRYNVETITTLKAIESENRFATPEEQEILAQYVGWGGLPQAFDSDNGSWTNEYAELKALLSPEEYTSARSTTLNAHYTSPIVIKAIYRVLENMGFKTGNILDPGCGIGNFQGLLPESMSDSKVYGVEIDPITGRIAQQLYQKNSILIQGYENTDLPDSFFDLAIGNVPFGNYKVPDRRYDKHKFLIHDYFFAKTLDKVRPGGIIAFITSKGTMDKENPSVRKYIAQRADLLGAIRLPNTAFKANAGTEVTADIIFLQKRDRIIDIEPEWVHLGELTIDNGRGELTIDNGQLTVPVNSYFVEHPEMILGTMSREDGVRMYGNANDTTCLPFPDSDLAELLDGAIQNIHAEITEYEFDEEYLREAQSESGVTLAADPSVRNFSYTIVDGQIYYRENSRMTPVEISVTAANRVKGMIAIRDCVRTLIEYQTDNYPNSDIRAEQARLNSLYDRYTSQYGLLSSRANSVVFSTDSAYPLLCSLEILDENGNLQCKADMFTKRTISANVPITSADTAMDALAASIAEKAGVDLAYMSELTGKDEDTLKNELQGVIFLNVGQASDQSQTYVTADEYLSGNVREKLAQAKAANEVMNGTLLSNVKALEAVQPQELTAAEISVRLGSTWIPSEVIRSFICELLKPGWRTRGKIDVMYSTHTGEWNITNKSADSGNFDAYTTYGTNRINAYRIIEETLNLRDVRVFDKVEDDQGREKRVLNKKETAIAQDKQEIIKARFQEWIWKNHNRREMLCELYNGKFNSIRPREYDGRHISFVGMNPEITLDPHQVNAVARIVYGGNSLLGHVVGAGKTYAMIAAAMESKRIGLCKKSIFNVPNHLTEQWAAAFLRLYPSANILVTSKKDFEPKNRRRFCARIATGDFDAVIIGHSQFEKIPVSLERQKAMLERQMDDIIEGIEEAQNNHGERFTIKQMEKSRKALEVKLSKLNGQERKDDTVTFEELGVDRVFVDEADMFKNLFLVTKMRNVGGIAQTDSQKASDLFMKTQYMDEFTNGRGVIFATGTPVSNTLAELYTMQRYLQYPTLERSGLAHFDCWASTFGETVTAMELSPEGSGFRQKTRFSRFHNLPEVICYRGSLK